MADNGPNRPNRVEYTNKPGPRISECGKDEWLVPVCLALNGSKHTHRFFDATLRDDRSIICIIRTYNR